MLVHASLMDGRLVKIMCRRIENVIRINLIHTEYNMNYNILINLIIF